MEVNALGILICRIKENGIHSIIVHSVFIFLIKQHQYFRIFLVVSMLIAWYKIHYPDVFFDAYLDMYATEDEEDEKDCPGADFTEVYNFIKEHYDVLMAHWSGKIDAYEMYKEINNHLGMAISKQDAET